MLLFDPQTSGGLLFGLSQGRLQDFEQKAREVNQPVWVVGEVREGKGIVVR
jgi:selenophosphate synthase